MGLWVFSPVTAVNHALRLYVEELGFEVELDPSKADAALFDLSSVGSPVPAAPKLPTLALLGPANADIVDEVLGAGYSVHFAHGSDEHLRMALTSLLTTGSTYAIDVQESEHDDGQRDEPQLTPREAQVLSLLMLGLTNKHIAKHLMITERTVKFHVASLLRKHGVNNRTKLMLKNPIVVTRLESGAPSRRR